jgi:hypothetical protein
MGDSAQTGGAAGGAGTGAVGGGRTAAPAAPAERIAAVAEKLNEFSPIRFVVRWMVAAFLVWLAWQIFFHHSDDKDDEDKDKDAGVSIAAPATQSPPAPGASIPDVGALISAALQSSSGAKAQWKSAVEASAGCWHRRTGDDNRTFGAYVRLVPVESGVGIATGKDAAALKKKGARLERHRLADDSATVGRLIFSVPPWTITNDTLGHLFVLDSSKADGTGAQLMYEKMDCPD